MLKDFLQKQKNELRQKLKNLRNSMLLPEKKNAEDAIMAKFLEKFTSSFCFGVYFPINSEVSPLEIIEHLHVAGKTIALPVIAKDDMEFKLWPHREPLVQGKFSLQPQISNAVLVPEVAITPLLGFDRSGNRIGYGWGYYDKYFTLHPSIYKVGLAFALQEMPSLPCNEWDIKLDLIITENEIILPKNSALESARY
jgi:5-formyltetrahydrofolate cyclo-ligase